MDRTELAMNEYDMPLYNCPGCGYEITGPVWGPDSLCRNCYEDRIPSPYCRHGNYIGYPGGPDYLCGYCEAGVTD